MNVRQMMFSAPEGGQATLAFPEPVTAETIAMLEEASALMFRTLRRDALKRAARDAGALEFDSWRGHDGEPRRGDGSLARDAGAIEYASWFVNA